MSRTLSMSHTTPTGRGDRMVRQIAGAVRGPFQLARDRLLEGIEVHPDDGILEVGCNSARNLICLHRRCPEASLYAIDPSAARLAAARRALRRRGIHSVTLQQGRPEELTPGVFGRRQSFDRILFSYSLSSMTGWDDALDAAWGALRPGGTLHVIDFWDQRGLPVVLATALRAWLSALKVHRDPNLVPYIAGLAKDGTRALELSPIAGRYAFLAVKRRPATE